MMLVVPDSLRLAADDVSWAQTMKVSCNAWGKRERVCAKHTSCFVMVLGV